MDTSMGQVIRIGADISNFVQGMNKVHSQMKNVGSKMASVGKTLTKSITVPIVGIAGASVKTGMEFEATMSKVSAITGATGKNFDMLKQQAKDLGAQTAWSAKEASEAMTYLGMAGFNTQQIMATMPSMLDLASASGTDLATTADIVSDALTAFGMKAEESGHLADIMAKASSTANTNVLMLGESYKYCAPIAHAFGMSAEETSATLAIMANSGIKASQAGTTLRGALTRLAKPTKDVQEWIDKLNLKLTDSKGNMLPFNNILGQMRDKYKNLTKEQQLQATTAIFGKQSMSGMLAVLNTSTEEFEKYTQTLKDSDGTSKKMAETMQNNLKGSITKLKSALEGAGIAISEGLAPVINDVVQKIQKWTDKFNSLDASTKKTIVQVGLLVAGIMPLIGIVGKTISTISAISTGLSTLAGIFGTTTVATTAGATATAGFGTAIGGALLTIAPWVAGIALVGTGIYKLYKHLSQDAIPQVKLFGDETSQATQKAVGAYMDLDNKAGQSLMNLQLTGQKVSQATKAELVKNFDEMGTQIKQGMKTKFDESYKVVEDFFANSKALNDKEEQEILQKKKANYDNQVKTVDEGTKQINVIIQKAIEDNRALNEQDFKQISEIKEKMKTNAVKNLSETELESKAILERMKAQSDELTAQQAVEVAKNSLDQKNKAVANANEQYNETVKNIIKMRDETGEVTAQQAEKLIADAKRQRDEAIRKAEEMHTQVVTHAKQQAGEHATQVDWEKCQVLSKFDEMIAKIKEFNKLTIKEKFIKITQQINSVFEKQNNSGMGTYTGQGSIPQAPPMKAKGDNDFKGGDVIAGEEGRELLIFPNGQTGITADVATLYNLPQHTQIIPNPKTEQMLKGLKWYAQGGVFENASIVGVGEETGVKEAIIPMSGSHMKPFAETIASLMGANGGNGLNQEFNFYSPKALNESDIKRNIREIGREQAFEMGV